MPADLISVDVGVQSYRQWPVDAPRCLLDALGKFVPPRGMYDETPSQPQATE